MGRLPLAGVACAPCCCAPCALPAPAVATPDADGVVLPVAGARPSPGRPAGAGGVITAAATDGTDDPGAGGVNGRCGVAFGAAGVDGVLGVRCVALDGVCEVVDIPGVAERGDDGGVAAWGSVVRGVMCDGDGCALTGRAGTGIECDAA